MAASSYSGAGHTLWGLQPVARYLLLMPTLESKNEEEPMPQRHTTTMFPDTARPSRARWQHWLAAGLLAAGFGGHAAVHAADAEGDVDWRG